MSNLRVVVIGASGKMGRAIIQGLSKEADITIVGGIDVHNLGEDIGKLAGILPLGILVTNQLEQVLLKEKPNAVIDFTHRLAAQKNIPLVLKNGISVVAGTTGFDETDLNKFEQLALENKTSIFLAPNFSLGAVLMMKFAQIASKYYQQSEIIEYHNDQKVDSPSGTALATSKKIAVNLPQKELKTETACRGGDFEGVKIHSVRLQSMVAHQEVLFAGKGEVLTIRHDSFSRESFLPGILLALRKVHNWQGLKVGLEEILE